MDAALRCYFLTWVQWTEMKSELAPIFPYKLDFALALVVVLILEIKKGLIFVEENKGVELYSR